MSPSASLHPVRIARQAMRNGGNEPWRLEDLAAAIGKSASLISNIEHGYFPKPGTCRKIAEALGTTVEQLWPTEFGHEQP